MSMERCSHDKLTQHRLGRYHQGKQMLPGSTMQGKGGEHGFLVMDAGTPLLLCPLLASSLARSGQAVLNSR